MDVTYSNDVMACARAETSSLARFAYHYKVYNQLVNVVNKAQKSYMGVTTGHIGCRVCNALFLSIN